MSLGARRIGWSVVLLLAALPFWVRPPSTPGQRSLAMQLLGPLAAPAAAVQWVRVDGAIRAGRTELALARAETAFALDPTATSGWFFLSRHLGLDLSSPERQGDPAIRLRWVRAALAIAARGERSASAPGELAFWQGLLLARTAEVDPELDWPGGARAMWSAAAEHFERAALLEHPDGALAAERARAVRDAR